MVKAGQLFRNVWLIDWAHRVSIIYLLLLSVTLVSRSQTSGNSPKVDSTSAITRAASSAVDIINTDTNTFHTTGTTKLQAKLSKTLSTTHSQTTSTTTLSSTEVTTSTTISTTEIPTSTTSSTTEVPTSTTSTHTETPTSQTSSTTQVPTISSTTEPQTSSTQPPTSTAPNETNPPTSTSSSTTKLPTSTTETSVLSDCKKGEYCFSAVQEERRERIERVCKKYKLPTTLPDPDHLGPFYQVDRDRRFLFCNNYKVNYSPPYA